MNLHSIVAPYIGVVNPLIPVQLQASTGYATNSDFTTTPSYAPAVTVLAQVQALSGKDLRQIEGLNLQGTLKTIYLNGEIDGVVRAQLKGGDLITLPDNSIWLVSHVLEPWNLTAGWTKAIITLQNGS